MRYLVVVTEASLAELKRPAHGLGFEIRLDSFSGKPDFAAIRAMTKAPLLATFRSKPHLGQAEPSQRAGRGWSWRMEALRAGFNGVDLELDESQLTERLATIKANGGWSVLSHHVLEPGGCLLKPLQTAMIYACDIIKIIGSGKSLADFVEQKRAYALAGSRQLVCFQMGAQHIGTRLLSLQYGAPFTFVLPQGADQVAPGVPRLDEMRELFAMDQLGESLEKLFAVIGNPIGHSQSPKFHNPRLKTIDPSALFLPILADCGEIPLLLETFPHMLGMAVTKPLKEDAFAMAEAFLDPAVAELGAVNTLLRRQGKWWGGNTDFSAMKEMLSTIPGGRKLRVVGYGGLGKAVVKAGLDLEMEVTVCNRSSNRLINLDPRVKVIPWPKRDASGADVIVQATSVGMAPAIDQSPLASLADDVKVLVETIYNPRETALMKMARSKGIRIIDGSNLFEKQAEIQNAYFKQALRDVPTHKA